MTRSLPLISALLLGSCSTPSYLGLASTGSILPVITLPGFSQPEPKQTAVPPVKVAHKVSTPGLECPRQTLAKKNVERLIVKVRASSPGYGIEDDLGSGIIIGQRDGKVYVLTAQHVVEDKTGAGKLVVSVAQQGGPWLKATKLASFQAPVDYPDVTVLEVEAASGEIAIAMPDLSVLRSVDGTSQIDTALVAGYPGGGDFVISEPAHAEADEKYLLVKAMVRQGNSGGGAFDAENRLAGLIVFNESAARAYPIHRILDAVKSAALPVDLTIAPQSKPRVQLELNSSGPDGLQQGLYKAAAAALEEAGYEPLCRRPGAYLLSLTTNVKSRSGTQKSVMVSGRLVTPDKIPLDLMPVELAFGWFEDLNSTDDVEKESKKVLSKLLDQISTIADRNKEYQNN